MIWKPLCNGTPFFIGIALTVLNWYGEFDIMSWVSSILRKLTCQRLRGLQSVEALWLGVERSATPYVGAELAKRHRKALLCGVQRVSGASGITKAATRLPLRQRRAPTQT